MARFTRCVLYSYDGSCDPLEEIEFPVIPNFDLDELRVANLSDDGVVIEVGIGFALRKGEEIKLTISASYRLRFVSETRLTEAEAEAIACRDALLEAWPMFVAHVARMLGELGLPPYWPSFQLMPEWFTLAPEVLAETREVDRRLAVPTPDQG